MNDAVTEWALNIHKTLQDLTTTSRLADPGAVSGGILNRETNFLILDGVGMVSASAYLSKSNITRRPILFLAGIGRWR